MTDFEHLHPRNDDGKFAAKPLEATDNVDLTAGSPSSRLMLCESCGTKIAPDHRATCDECIHDRAYDYIVEEYGPMDSRTFEDIYFDRHQTVMEEMKDEDAQTYLDAVAWADGEEIRSYLQMNHLPPSDGNILAGMDTAKSRLLDGQQYSTLAQIREHMDAHWLDDLTARDTSSFLAGSSETATDTSLGLQLAIREALVLHGRVPHRDHPAAMALGSTIYQRLVTTNPDGTQQRWHAVEADDRFPQHTEYVSTRDEGGTTVRMSIQPGDDTRWDAQGFAWSAKSADGIWNFSGQAATVEEAQHQAAEHAEYITSGEAYADSVGDDDYTNMVDAAIDSVFEA